MEFTLAITGYLVGLPLELLVIAAMLHGGAYREFPAAFAYAVAEFLTTVVEIPLALAWYRTNDAQLGMRYAYWYWRDERIMQFLVLAVVISLLWMATNPARSRRILRLMIVVGIGLLAGISLLAHYDSRIPEGRWMTFWSRDLNFGAAVLDMLLWAMLIAKRQKDSRLLMLSAGLGIMFAGEAIGQSVRNLATHHSAITLPGSILVMLTSLAFLYIWWQTFRVPRPVLVSAP